jgi:hypothetical protein
MDQIAKSLNKIVAKITSIDASIGKLKLSHQELIDKLVVVEDRMLKIETQNPIGSSSKAFFHFSF